MEQIDYTEMLPTQPPEGMTAFLNGNGYLTKEYIVYGAEYVEQEDGTKRKMVKCTCTACGGISYNRYMAAHACSYSYPPAPFGFYHPELPDTVICGESTLCPCCGAEVEAIHTGRMHQGKTSEDYCYPITVENIDGKLAIIEWQAKNVIYKDGTRKIKYFPSEAAVVEKKKIVRCNGLRRYYYSYIELNGWEQRAKYSDEIGAKGKALIYPFEPGVLIGTFAENSKLDIYIRDCDKPVPVAYLKLWQIHRNVENLVMQGASELLTESMGRCSQYNWAGSHRRIIAKNVTDFNWNEVKPHLMLGTNISKDEFKYIVKNKLRRKEVEIYKLFKEYIDLEDTSEAVDAGSQDITKIIEMGMSVRRTLRYLKKQKEKYPENETTIDSTELLDYWEMAQELGESLKKVAYPKNLVSAHNRCLARKKWAESEKLKPLFSKRAKVLESYCYREGNLEIRPAQTEKEMIVEGELLHHCVARYAEDHAKGKTAIFFIRHTTEPEQPYFTLELDEEKLKVRQNRGLRNCDRTDEVIIFEEKWLKFIKEVHKNVRNNRSRVS